MSTYSIRTQIRLSGEQHRLLKERAQRSKQSIAELVRRAIDQYLGRRLEAEEILPPDDPIFQIIGGGASDVTDLSIHHDKYLYSLETKK